MPNYRLFLEDYANALGFNEYVHHSYLDFPIGKLI